MSGIRVDFISNSIIVTQAFLDAAAGNCGKGEGYISGMSKNKSTVSVIAGQ